MRELDAAVRIVEEELERAYRQQSARTRSAGWTAGCTRSVRAAVTEWGRIPATHLLRQRVPAPAHGQVVAQVTGLGHGSAPTGLVDIATRELVPPVDPVMALHTIRAG
ncbi:hypothetical protein ACFWN1_23500 [Streptomyces sp. NPDC058459]|uniref:hypothetical protein n=1 Tax=Streptomyces sp. NPDC058459 TaxID=3346508 RepID=UPI003656D08E